MEFLDAPLARDERMIIAVNSAATTVTSN